MKSKQQHHFWTTQDIRTIERNLHLTDVQLGELLDKTFTSVRAMRKRYGLIKAHRGYFPKGGKPWNKGKSFNAGGRSAETRFKKGQKPVKMRSVGEVFNIPDKGKSCYYIKLEGHRQYSYPRHLYETHHGIKLTPNDVIRFKDGDRENLNPDNLIKVTRQENIRMNSNRIKAGESMRVNWKQRNIGSRVCIMCTHEFVKKIKTQYRCPRCKSHATIEQTKNIAA